MTDAPGPAEARHASRTEAGGEGGLRPLYPAPYTAIGSSWDRRITSSIVNFTVEAVALYRG